MYTFVESPLFTRLVGRYLNDQEYLGLQQALMNDPQRGEVIKGSGGVRKLRWRAPGRGKRGGYRVIYFVRFESNVIWMLTMYPKNVAETIPVSLLKQFLEVFEDE